MKTLSNIIQSNDLIEEVKSAILSNVIIKIRNADTKELLFSCATDEYYGLFKTLNLNLEVDQDIELTSLLEELNKILK
jgi:hypothetical protein